MQKQNPPSVTAAPALRAAPAWLGASREKKASEPKGTHIHVFGSKSIQRRMYYFFVSPNGVDEGQMRKCIDPPERNAADFLASKKVPQIFIEQLHLINSDFASLASPREIIYSISDSGEYETETYLPKAKYEFVRGFGYYLELISAHSIALEDSGAKFSTSHRPSFKRMSQLEKVGLEPRKAYSADEWIGSLAKGVKNVLERYQKGSGALEQFVREYM